MSRRSVAHEDYFKGLRTLDYSEHHLIISKPPKTHFDEILPATEWVPAHRLDFETSGCLLFVRPRKLDIYRKLFSNPGKVTKLYLCGTCLALPWMAEATSPNTGTKHTGFIASRYRSSKKVKYFSEFDPPNPNKFHSIQKAEHSVWASTPQELQVSGAQGAFGPHIYTVKLVTGARHQIRAFFASQDCPINGDPIYGKSLVDGSLVTPRLQLHAFQLEFESPEDPGKKVSAVAKIID